MLISSRTIHGRCPTCGAEHAACGQPSDTIPVDHRIEEAAMGGPLKKYKVTTPQGVEAVLKLNDADAERLGGTLVEPAEAVVEPPDPVKSPVKKRAAANKSRTAPNKGAGGAA